MTPEPTFNVNNTAIVAAGLLVATHEPQAVSPSLTSLTSLLFRFISLDPLSILQRQEDAIATRFAMYCRGPQSGRPS